MQRPIGEVSIEGLMAMKQNDLRGDKDDQLFSYCCQLRHSKFGIGLYVAGPCDRRSWLGIVLPFSYMPQSATYDNHNCIMEY